MGWLEQITQQLQRREWQSILRKRYQLTSLYRYAVSIYFIVYGSMGSAQDTNISTKCAAAAMAARGVAGISQGRAVPFAYNSTATKTFQQLVRGNNTENKKQDASGSSGVYAITLVAGNSSTATGKSTIVDPADTCSGYTFRKTIGGTQTGNAWDVQTNAAGYFLLTGISRSVQTGSDSGMVMILQPSGRIQWSISLGGEGVTRLHSGRFTSDGGSIHAGIHQSGRLSSLCLVKLDPQGNISWSKKYNSGQTIGPLARVIQCMDGGYLVSTGAVEDNASPAYLVKTDSAGNIAWSLSFPGLITVQDAIAEGKNDFILSVFNQPGHFVYRGTLVSVDKMSGKVNWAKYYDLNGTGIVTDNIYPYADGWLVSLLFRDNAKVLVSHGFMITTHDGAIKKICRVKSPDQTNIDFVTNVTVNKAGNICFPDGVLPAGGDQDATLLEVSPEGQLVRNKRYQLPLSQLIFGIQGTADGGVVMAGLTASPTSFNDLWMVKTDSLLNTSCTTPGYAATIEQPAVVSTTFYANAVDLLLNAQDLALRTRTIHPTAIDDCPDPALCSAIHIIGPDSVSANEQIVFFAGRSEGCHQPLHWTADRSVADIDAANGNAVMVRFKKTGWLYASVEGKCNSIMDSIWVHVCTLPQECLPGYRRRVVKAIYRAGSDEGIASLRKRKLMGVRPGRMSAAEGENDHLRSSR